MSFSESYEERIDDLKARRLRQPADK